jgi:predicted Zn-dependent peptidase
MYAAFASEASGGPTEDELAIAKKQMANTLDEEMRDPSFWSRRLAQLTFRATNLDDIVNEPAAYQALTADTIRKTFARYYGNGKDNSIVVVVKPQEAPTPDAPSAGSGGR